MPMTHHFDRVMCIEGSTIYVLLACATLFGAIAALAIAYALKH